MNLKVEKPYTDEWVSVLHNYLEVTLCNKCGKPIGLQMGVVMNAPEKGFNYVFHPECTPEKTFRKAAMIFDKQFIALLFNIAPQPNRCKWLKTYSSAPIATNPC